MLEFRTVACESGAAPGHRLPVRRLASPVVSCEEAALARGVPLERELKTLILQTSHGWRAAHLPGDRRLNLRLVKRRIGAREARLAAPGDLRSLGLEPGTVSAVLDPVWSMQHLVSRSLLEAGEVTTNDGTTTGYFTFDPRVLLAARHVVIDRFDAPSN